MKTVNKTILVKAVFRSALFGLLSSVALLTLYGVVVRAISGTAFLRSQFTQYGWYLAALALGFGIQVSLFVYLRSRQKQLSKATVATTGSTSTVAMLSCCAHYAVNFLPVLGITGVLSFVSQFQVELFWVGIAANIVGIAIISRHL